MQISKNTILVPWDFTEVTENALSHAIKIAGRIKSTVTLIHIASSKDRVRDFEKLAEEDCNRAFNKFGLKPGFIVKSGSIFSTINDTAVEIEAAMVVMGTHGVKGMQKLTGSWALKIIAGSKIPYIVVQSAPQHDHYKKLVFPVDHKTENKEKLLWVVYLSKFYKLEAELFIPLIQDEDTAKKIQVNLNFTKKYLADNNIEFNVSVAPKKGSFGEQTVEFAHERDADLILIMTTKDIKFIDYLFGPTEQQIIANSAKIPVMCINPRMDLKKIGIYA
ncbi:MAG: hypothetical protein A2W91_14315 [Bacteroidetes bacterium GWF2_38_335]|nr:MAG: hypothetical protein A2W91_14315 [Bacteroidetes bacterium GWF2_38_335]OFY79366.1 MAG: hypothetical protein A2281_16840 [Bacteroidetes bacterium RIFOXYA12_FULL_38_20]